MQAVSVDDEEARPRYSLDYSGINVTHTSSDAHIVCVCVSVCCKQ